MGSFKKWSFVDLFERLRLFYRVGPAEILASVVKRDTHGRDSREFDSTELKCSKLHK